MCTLFSFSITWTTLPFNSKQMCGFTAYLQIGAISKDGDPVAPVLDLGGALDLINHRGPDARGIYISPDGRCGKKKNKKVPLFAK
jgi:asparagine synthetase B (glutamine-hydrolysing)